MAAKNGNSKIIWFVLFTIVTVILCYLFTVVYFYFISPYNIKSKLGSWPFVSDQAIGDMYLDATVEINFKAVDDHFENVDVSVVGVNVKKDGYILAPLSEFADCATDAQIKIFTNTGTAYDGELVCQDDNSNLVVIKCKNMDGSKKSIKIPYVSVGSIDSYTVLSKVYMTSMSSRTRAISSQMIVGMIEDNEYYKCATKEVDGVTVRDFTVCHGFIVQAKNNASFNGGAVFDKKGQLLGFNFGELMDAPIPEGQYFFQPAYAARSFLKNVFEKKGEFYENKLVGAVCGFDSFEADDMVNTYAELVGRNTFYFDRTWNNITEEIRRFTVNVDGGFYLFKDFVYKDKTIEANSVLTDVKVGGKTTAINYRCDLIDVLYSAKKGQNIVLYFVNGDDGTPQTISFAV